jgi:hypothetical protein
MIYRVLSADGGTFRAAKSTQKPPRGCRPFGNPALSRGRLLPRSAGTPTRRSCCTGDGRLDGSRAHTSVAVGKQKRDILQPSKTKCAKRTRPPTLVRVRFAKSRPALSGGARSLRGSSSPPRNSLRLGFSSVFGRGLRHVSIRPTGRVVVEYAHNPMQGRISSSRASRVPAQGGAKPKRT